MSAATQEAIADKIEFAAEDGTTLTRLEAIRALLLDIEDGAAIADRSLLTPLRKELIERGVYVALTQDDLDRIQVSGGKKYDFQMAGVKYGFESWQA